MLQISIERIGPDKAKAYLLTNSSNRTISPQTVNAYAQDMLRDKWHLTHQGIAIFDDGALADGQHRLHAIIKSGKEVEMLVTKGLPRSPSIDRNRPRSISDCASIIGVDWIDKSVVGIITAMYAKNRISRGKFTPDELIPIAEKYKESILFVTSTIGKRAKGISHSGVAAACVMAIECGIPKEKIARLLHVLKTGVVDDAYESSIIRLRDFLITGDNTCGGSEERIKITLKTQRVIKAFVDKEKLSKIVTPESLIYSPENI